MVTKGQITRGDASFVLIAGRPAPGQELFARALDGEPVDDAPTLGLVSVASRVSTLQIAGPNRAGTAARAAIVGAAGVALAEAAKHAATTGALHAAAQTTTQAAARQGFLHVLVHSAALPLATGLAAVTVGAGAVGVAAHRSVPGNPFYGVKRAGESLRLDLATSSTDRADIRLAQARTRLHEIEQVWPGLTASGAPSYRNTVTIASLVTSLDHDVALATGPLLAAGGTAVARLTADVTSLQTTLASLPRTVAGSGAAAVQTSIGLLGTLSASVSSLPVIVPGTGPTGVAPSAPTHVVRVAPTTTPTTRPAVPTPVTSTPPSVVRASPSSPAVLPSLPSLPVTVPSVSVPLRAVPPVIPSAVPSAVSSAVCGLLGIVGATCPTGA
jgi:hypothetical protein